MENQISDRFLASQFITEIDIKNVLEIKDIILDLDGQYGKHLIVTGRNGSGKTTLLKTINAFITNALGNQGAVYANHLQNVNQLNLNNDQKARLIHQAEVTLQTIISSFGVNVKFKAPELIWGKMKNSGLIFTFFEAKRQSTFNTPSSISRNNLPKHISSGEVIRNTFLQYIVNKKAQQSFARDDNDFKAVTQIENWFINLENQLKLIFEDQSLKLTFNRTNFSYNIKLINKPAFDLNQLSDGYAAVFSIITEMILRMEALDHVNYDLPGIILIDEIETHLHVDLQKKILPFLTAFFPNIQFIVTTHSPFVITSLKDAVICDLERKIIVNDLSAYSYDAIIESYYNSDKYSDEVKVNLTQYEKLLSNLSNLSDEENSELFELSKYFDGVPKHLAKELQMKLIQLQLEYHK